MTEEEFEEKCAEWHTSDSDLPLHEFLGMTEDDYWDYVTRNLRE